jgi:hypothetical protein
MALFGSAKIRDILALLTLTMQAAALLVLAQAFHLASPAFYRQILPLMLGGAVVNQRGWSNCSRPPLPSLASSAAAR